QYALISFLNCTFGVARSSNSSYLKPSGVFFIAVRSLGNRFPSPASLSSASGMWAATYTKPATSPFMSLPATASTNPREASLNSQERIAQSGPCVESHRDPSSRGTNENTLLIFPSRPSDSHLPIRLMCEQSSLCQSSSNRNTRSIFG